MHIGSGLNTVSSLYGQQKGNQMKTPASGEKTFCTVETPKVYQIFTTDNMLWTGGNGQCHLDKDYTKNSVYRNMYPVLFL